MPVTAPPGPPLNTPEMGKIIYTTEAGNTYHAKDRDSAIKQCPELRNKPPEEANALMDLALLGQEFMPDTIEVSENAAVTSTPGEEVKDEEGSGLSKLAFDLKAWSQPDKNMTPSSVAIQPDSKHLVGSSVDITDTSIEVPEAKAAETIQPAVPELEFLQRVATGQARANVYPAEELQALAVGPTKIEREKVASEPIVNEPVVTEEPEGFKYAAETISTNGKVDESEIPREKTEFKVEKAGKSKEIIVKEKEPPKQVVVETEMIASSVDMDVETAPAEPEVAETLNSLSFDDYAAGVVEVSVETLDEYQSEIMDPAVTENSLEDMIAEIYARTQPQIEAPETEIYADEPLSAELVEELTLEEVFEDFAEALQIFIAMESDAEPGTVPGFEQVLIKAGEDSEMAESEPVAPIVVTVAERLKEIEPALKQEVAPTLAEIVEVVREIQTMEDAAPEELEAAEAKLEELCIELFKALGIDYGAEDIKQFVQVLPRPEFQPVRIMAAQTVWKTDLESELSHEAKDQPAHTKWADVKQDFKQLLGKLILHAARNNQSKTVSTIPQPAL